MAAANAYQKHLDESEDNQILYSTEEDGKAIDEKVHTRLVSLDTTCMCEGREMSDLMKPSQQVEQPQTRSQLRWSLG